ncbi:MAG: PIG-L family deacetylase [Candidatus Korobacteraceae bacterium]
MAMREWKAELTGRVLVLVAHADDECVGYGALLQKTREAVVVIATDGAPRDEFFRGRYGSRERYAAVRREEAQRAAQVAGVRELVLLAEEDGRLGGHQFERHRFEDQRLFLNLAAAYELAAKVAERVRPEAIATLAYEGGHPDHDCCSLLGARLGARLGVPVWETALYARGKVSKVQGFKVSEVKGTGESNGNRNGVEGGAPDDPTSAKGEQIWGTQTGPDGELRVQEFLCANGTEQRVEISAAELERKRAMVSEYESQQSELLESFDLAREVVRPQVRYDYGRAPHEGRTNYECWGWWMSAREVSARLAEFLESGR